MSIEPRTIRCDVEGCGEEYTEKELNGGFPDWGHVEGVMNDETVQVGASLCPAHMANPNC